MTVKTQTPIKKYDQLSKSIQAQIETGELSPNQQLPTEAQLATQYAISRGTVRKAIDRLTQLGLVRREQGRGMFVNDPSQRMAAGFMLGDFSAELRQQNKQPSTKVIVQQMVPATAQMAAMLEIPEGDLVIQIVRMRSADNQPILLEERLLNAKLCPNLITEDLAKQSIHWLLIHKYKLPMVRVNHTIQLQTAQTVAQGGWGNTAQKLNLQPTDPVFTIDRLTFTQINGKTQPAVWFKAVCNADEYQYKAQFNTLI